MLTVGTLEWNKSTVIEAITLQSMKRPSSDANTSLIKVVISNNTSVAID
jgi:hypothetical protein